MDALEWVRMVKDRVLEDLFTIEVGEVVAYHEATTSSPPTADVRILVTDWDGNEFPVLPRVPVVYLGAGNLGVYFPMDPGAQGVVLFVGRGLDLWSQLGTLQVADEAQRFWMSNAIFVPGIRALTQAVPGLVDAAGRMVVGYLSDTAADKRTVEMSEDGIRIGSGTVEVLESIRDALVSIRDCMVATALGPQPLDQVTRLALGGLGQPLPGPIDKIDEVRDGS